MKRSQSALDMKKGGPVAISRTQEQVLNKQVQEMLLRAAKQNLT